MKKRIFFKIITILSFQFCIFFSFGQKKDESNEIFFVAITEFNNLVRAFPNGNENCREGTFITEKDNLFTLDKKKSLDKEYLIFYPGCYEIIDFTSLINKYIIPNIYNDSISNILKSNPKKWNHFCPDTKFSKIFFIENFRYMEITHKKYMVLLVPLRLYNHMIGSLAIDNPCKIFNNEPKDFVYIKVLIAICDEN